eukprot:6179602-Pleurochrysis_carterae.AAC.6
MRSSQNCRNDCLEHRPGVLGPMMSEERRHTLQLGATVRTSFSHASLDFPYTLTGAADDASA